MQGRIEEFCVGCDRSLWPERIGFRLEDNNVIQSSKKRALLLSICREHTYGTLRAVVFPRIPGEVNCEDIVRVLGEHFDPKPSVCLGSCRFHNRGQLASETIL